MRKIHGERSHVAGAGEAQQQPNAQQRFEQLKQKYQTVLNEADQQHIQFQNLHVQDNKLFIRGTAPSEDAKNRFWDQIKLVDPNNEQDLIADITVAQGQAQGAAVGGVRSLGRTNFPGISRRAERWAST